jgi:hypothetical protein
MGTNADVVRDLEGVGGSLRQRGCGRLETGD